MIAAVVVVTTSCLCWSFAVGSVVVAMVAWNVMAAMRVGPKNATTMTFVRDMSQHMSLNMPLAGHRRVAGFPHYLSIPQPPSGAAGRLSRTAHSTSTSLMN